MSRTITTARNGANHLARWGLADFTDRGRKVSYGFVPVVLMAFGFVTASAAAPGPQASSSRLHWPQQAAPTLQLDNDLFAVSNRDRDYAGCLAASFPQTAAPARWDPQRLLEPLARAPGTERVLRARQFQIVAFSPGELSQAGIQHDDRPYASLWAIASARQVIAEDGRQATFTSLAIGALGLQATAAVHRALHRLSATELPEGYAHQISAGGEPTASLMMAHRQLLVGGDIGPGTDLWVTVAGRAGYLTEASIGVTARFGDRGTPWWSSGADLADYAAAPDFGIASLGGERSVEVGMRVSARAYNALVQGPFRHSDLRLDRSDLETIVARAWVGATLATFSGARFYYRLTAQTACISGGR